MNEFYQMPLFVKLKVKDIEKSKEWYGNVLNFNSVFDFPDANGTTSMTHLRGAKYQDLMLLQDEEVNTCDSVIINLFSSDIHSIYQAALENKTNIIQKPTVQPWNAKELTLEDPDGYVFTITESVDSNKDFDTVIDNVKGQL
ncbi:VOC family protein [Lysinibacillus xylanilyticus]|uniref:VOC family protein n=1 Tax=Lysinibacillus xylanilyticus TaxID=582475 RepID=UPI002B251B88|nr:VOC family protein [Lysinibacillus xylanilyticus]MEB2281706.1 VOC family protein [Lysinibacillus xylanilyticus]